MNLKETLINDVHEIIYMYIYNRQNELTPKQLKGTYLRASKTLDELAKIYEGCASNVKEF
jgi:hypothetical protein